MVKSKGIGRGGARPGSGRKRKAITSRLEALKNALAALLSSDASNFCDADQRFVRAMIALGAAAIIGIIHLFAFQKGTHLAKRHTTISQ